ncbi:hypothetical protein HJG60_009755 [Phyllostomus discolor]|uniref:L1 transposable element RRM domain-containing protein n=1 Tax=Phyllostomus discolor TaxID=89673 RepID=A0A834B6Q3_9CHIR|nr:hypothetical protein HJG60_009755 [Phyllostomus discolor]
MKSEIEENIQGTNSEGEETRTQINGLNQKEKRNIQPDQNEETRIQKNEDRLRNLHDNLKYSNSQKEKRKSKKLKLFEYIMKENFPNLAKEIDFQEVQEAHSVPQKLDPRKHTPRHTIITLPKMKDKKRILKAAREKERDTYKGVPIRLS